ncbi:salicylate hydroxylase [Lasallia pustulata]|nr:salicylate hydroxylase [Lasallia pustulata]
MAEGSCNAETGKAALVHLKILVVGAGIGGLAAGIALARRGHNVTIFEQAPQMGEVGAGIQMPSNTNRLLLRWGLGPFLGDKVVEPEGMSFRRWKDGSLIGYTKLVPDFQENFEAPYYVVHRAHLHDSMRRLAVELGVEIRTACRVMSYDTETPSLTLQDGISFTGDLIIAADGINSSARRVILGVDTPPLKTGLAAYRATVDVEKIRQDPEIAWIVAKPCLNLWIGEMRHVMTYTIAGGKSFNIVLNHAEDTHPSTWNQDSNIADMREQFGDWDPQLTKIIYMIDRTMKWPLMTGATLGKWTSPSGKLLMLGDAAHAMLPYMSQGAGMAIEDAAGLAEALSKIHSKDELSIAVNVFEAVRVKRSNQMQEASMINSKLWHFPDGPVQEARDEAMRPETEGRHFDESPNQWSDPVTQAWCYGYDAEKEVAKAW